MPRPPATHFTTKTKIIRISFAAGAVFAFASFPGTAVAQFTDTFDTINPAWVPNRYDPAGFESVSSDGNNRLRLTIDVTGSTANRPALFKSEFYNIQGRARPGDITGQWTLSAQVYVSSAFKTTTGRLVRGELWGHTGTTPDGGAYMILGFTNASLTDTHQLNPAATDRIFRFQAFDGNTGNWIDLGIPDGFVFDAWHTLSGTSTGTTFEYRIDGILVRTNTTSAGDDLMSAMVQGYNFGEAGSYSVYWDNVTASAPNTAAPSTQAPDFNGDGKTDIIWSDSITGERAIWLMNGTTFLASSTLGIFPREWTVAATADFNGDGKPDIIWSNSITGERAIWLMNGTTFLGSSTLGIFPLEWTVAATSDFNGDGKPDIIWSNRITGERAIWLMNGTNFLGASTLGIFPLEWTVAGTGDFNGDGKPDIIWSNSITGERALWLMNGTTFLGASTLGIFPLEWTIAGTGDFNGNGKPDIIWSNSLTGERAIWLMNGTTFLSNSTLGIFPLEWTVKN